MAAFSPQQQSTMTPHLDYPTNTPPDQAFPPLPSTSDMANMSKASRKAQHRVSGDHQHGNGVEGGRAIPTGPGGSVGNAGPRGHSGYGGFEAARSPPNAKNTSHVPCKFFKLGQCQAGKACPFSHSTDASAFEQPCKYFSKGNCKFGHKCALLHVLPNGRVVNRPNASLGHLNIGNRMEPLPYQQESALGDALAQRSPGVPQPFGHQVPQMPELDLPYQPPSSSQPFDIPQGPPHSSRTTPRDEPRLPMSSPRHLTALDAPLPASFDSQGISYLARHGPVAASVPSKFGFESPPPSLPKKSGLHSDAIRTLHDSAYGREPGNRFPNLGSSPSGQQADHSVPRMMHSQRVARPKMMSSSLPRPNMSDDWEQDDLLFGGEEDYIPGNLSHLLNHEERVRRTSAKIDDPHAIRESLGVGEFSSKMGSPSHASPSRFSAFFTKQKQDEPNGLPSSSFGQLGSPLRGNSHLSTSPGVRSTSRASGSDIGFQVSSPPRQSATSMLSQQLQRTRLSRAESTESTPSMQTLGMRPGARATVDRAVSSSSVTTSRIDEESADCLFAFDDLGGAGKQVKASNLGSIGDGRRSLDKESVSDGRPSLERDAANAKA